MFRLPARPRFSFHFHAATYLNTNDAMAGRRSAGGSVLHGPVERLGLDLAGHRPGSERPSRSGG